MAYKESNGYVTNDIMWPWKVKVVSRDHNTIRYDTIEEFNHFNVDKNKNVLGNVEYVQAVKCLEGEMSRGEQTKRRKWNVTSYRLQLQSS